MIRFLKAARLELAVTACCAWQAGGLLTAWRHSPFDRWGWLSFLAWLAPCLAQIVPVSRWTAGPGYMTGVALAAAIAGQVLELNALLCAALALALATFVPPSPRRTLWLFGSLAWMPALGWLAHDFPTSTVVVLRLVLATATSAPLLFLRPALTRSPP